MQKETLGSYDPDGNFIQDLYYFLFPTAKSFSRIFESMKILFENER